ncbi:MAG: potassium transporter TrkG, partial [Pelovirga sp.]
MTDRAPYGIFLRARYRVILGYTGLVCAIIGAIILAPALLVLFFPDQRALAGTFLLTGLTLLLLSAATWHLCRPPAGASLSFNEGAVVVVLSWLVAIGAGAIPFLASGADVTRAVFESTSGWTTTGLSVVDVTSAPALLLFFRSLM